MVDEWMNEETRPRRGGGLRYFLLWGPEDQRGHQSAGTRCKRELTVGFSPLGGHGVTQLNPHAASVGRWHEVKSGTLAAANFSGMTQATRPPPTDLLSSRSSAPAANLNVLEAGGIFYTQAYQMINTSIHFFVFDRLNVMILARTSAARSPSLRSQKQLRRQHCHPHRQAAGQAAGMRVQLTSR